MTITHREDLPGRKVKLTIAIDKETWQQALADAYRENHAFYPVEGCAPGAATREALEAVDNRVCSLERIRFGPLTLDGRLARGEWRYLTSDEITALEAHSDNANK